MRSRAVARWLALIGLLSACRVERVAAQSSRVDAAAPTSVAPAVGGGARADATPKSVSVPASVIAGGKSAWVDSNLDPEFALINARVDIGTLKQVGDELEATLRWPIGPGTRRDLQSSHPELRLPDGAFEEDRERFHCGRDRLAYFAIETTYLTADGAVLRHERLDVAKARQEEVARAAAMPKSSFKFATYGGSPRDLVCWAAARKCRHEPFTWPPPPNDTRFDDPRYAEQRDAHDAQFVPTCTLR
jgi:hypothetical protein